jgi:predicted HTH domain antitoxin
MIILEIEIPEEIFSDLRKTREEMKNEVLLAAAVKLFELGSISGERGAVLAGLSRWEFIRELGRFKVSPFQYSLEELQEEQKLFL